MTTHGFEVWARKDGSQRVTVPTRPYVSNGQRKSFALLRHRVRHVGARQRADEHGHYSITDGAIRFARQETTTTWPYRVDGDQLRLTEVPGDVPAYARCGGPRACGR